MALVPVPDVGGFSKTSKAFQAKAVEVARDIGVPPGDLVAVMAFESGRTFAPDIQPGMTYYRQRPDEGRAVGLIQFTKVAIDAINRKAGTDLTKSKLAHMSNVEQLDKWVRYYFKGLNTGSYRDVRDLYRTVFWPLARGKPDSWVAMRRSHPAYGVNKGLDYGNKGYITAGDIDRHVVGMLAAAKRRPPAMVDTSVLSGSWWPAVVGVGLGTVTAFAAGIVVKSLLTSQAKSRRRAR